MPIRTENLGRYLGGSPASKEWRALVRGLLTEAGNACEGSPAYPDCRAVNQEPHPATGSRVVLTIGHLDHRPEHNDRSNLRVWCQRCHNTYDAPTRLAGRASRRVALRMTVTTAAAGGAARSHEPEDLPHADR